MKKAVIFTTTKNASTFREARGFLNREICELSTHNYNVEKYKVTELNIIPEQLARITDGTLGFLWLRFHGTPKSMAVCENGDITGENIGELFKNLVNKMTEDGIIYLEACSTGSLKNDFYNNMQFAFAKLTLNKLGVRIIAPSQDSYLSQFCINDIGEFSFKAIASPYKSEDITVILNEDTKRLLQDAATKAQNFDSVADSLRASLNESKSLVTFLIKDIPTEIMLDAQYDFASILRTILADKDRCSKTVLAMVKQLIEEHYVEANTASDDGFYAFFWYGASPLSAAIYRAEPELVTYLLSKGADANQVFRHRPLVELAEIHAKQIKDFRCLAILQEHLGSLDKQSASRFTANDFPQAIAVNEVWLPDSNVGKHDKVQIFGGYHPARRPPPPPPSPLPLFLFSFHPLIFPFGSPLAFLFFSPCPPPPPSCLSCVVVSPSPPFFSRFGCVVFGLPFGFLLVSWFSFFRFFFSLLFRSLLPSSPFLLLLSPPLFFPSPFLSPCLLRFFLFPFLPPPASLVFFFSSPPFFSPLPFSLSFLPFLLSPPPFGFLSAGGVIGGY